MNQIKLTGAHGSVYVAPYHVLAVSATGTRDDGFNPAFGSMVHLNGSCVCVSERPEEVVKMVNRAMLTNGIPTFEKEIVT